MFLAIDIDAFYCAVEQRENSKLRDQPFCVIQKHIVASPSYAARRLGVKKLSTVSEVQEKFPEMELINGENLAKYRAAGAEIWNWIVELTSTVVEKGGMEEFRFDLSPSIRASLTGRLKRISEAVKACGSLMDELCSGITLQLSKERFECDDFFFQFDGITFPEGQSGFFASESLEAYTAGHLACYVRDRMHLEMGYPCTIGVASTSILAKMVCSMGKPHGVAVLTPGYELKFLNPKLLKEIPGFGRATVAKLEEKFGQPLTVEALHRKSCYQEIPDLWDLSFGKDVTPLKHHAVPKQVSVENTYRYLLSMPGPEIDKLLSSLLRQFKHDLWNQELRVWRALPIIFRVSILLVGNSSRKSRSVRVVMESAQNPELQLNNFQRQLARVARHMLKRLTSEPVRMLNVALILEPNSEIIEI